MTFLHLTAENLQWMGCATGVLGSAMLAINRANVSGFGFVAYVVSNGCWIGYALATSSPGLLTQQAVFTVTSLVGVWRWVLAPRLQK